MRAALLAIAAGEQNQLQYHLVTLSNILDWSFSTHAYSRRERIIDQKPCGNSPAAKRNRNRSQLLGNHRESHEIIIEEIQNLEAHSSPPPLSMHVAAGVVWEILVLG